MRYAWHINPRIIFINCPEGLKGHKTNQVMKKLCLVFALVLSFAVSNTFAQVIENPQTQYERMKSSPTYQQKERDLEKRLKDAVSKAQKEASTSPSTPSKTKDSQSGTTTSKETKTSYRETSTDRSRTYSSRSTPSTSTKESKSTDSRASKDSKSPSSPSRASDTSAKSQERSCTKGTPCYGVQKGLPGLQKAVTSSKK